MRIIFVGGGVVGLCGALILANDGHDITIVERDAATPPDPEAAWNDWDRRGVNQFRMLHYFAPAFRRVMDANAPEVIQAMLDAGALRINPFEALPAEVTGGWRDGDEAFTSVTARRPVAESAIARLVDAHPNVTIRRGTPVAGLLTSDSARNGTPHVVGVRTETGDELRADLVVDCGGRRSTLPAMLAAIGTGPPVEELEDCGFIYWGRHFKSADGSVPFMLGPLLMPYRTVSALTLPADNGTWGVGVVTSSKDTPLRALKDIDAWTRVVKTFPLQAHWLDGEPLDDKISIMAKIEDRHRTFVVDGKPLATGVLALADSWAATNPSVGRGMSIGAIHTVALRDLLHEPDPDPVSLAQRWHAATMEAVEPWYRDTLAFDSGRLDQIHSGIEERAFTPTPEYDSMLRILSALPKSPESFRTGLKLVGMLETASSMMGDTATAARVKELGTYETDDYIGPERGDVLAAAAG